MDLYAIYAVLPIAAFLVVTGLSLKSLSGKSDSTLLVSFFPLSGLITLICIGYLITLNSSLARYAPVVIGSLTILSLAANATRYRNWKFRADYLLVFSSSYLLAGLPLLAVGKKTWPGWVQLDDTSTFLAMTEYLFDKGRQVPTILQSTFDRAIEVNFSDKYPVGNYPTGSLVPLGTLSRILNLDGAWIYFPYLCLLVAITATFFFHILKKTTSNVFFAAIAAITSSFASTWYSYALWGGIKEVLLVPVILYFAYGLHTIFINRANPRQLTWVIVQNALTLFSLFSIGGKSILGIVAAVLIVQLIIVAFNSIQPRLILLLSMLVALVLGFAWQKQSVISSWLAKKVVTQIPDSGNLARNLHLNQLLGIWPSSDFRADVYWAPWIYLLFALVAVLSLYGIATSIYHRELYLSSAAIATVAVALYSYRYGGIWLTGKAIAIASPLVLLCAVQGISYIMTKSKMRLTSILLLTSVLSGVLTSNFLSYRNTWIAPSEKMNELSVIGKQFRNQGPALMTDYSPFGARYFLRELKAESASELRVNTIPMRNGREVPKGFSADIDLFENATLVKYPLLVLRHSATGSRPLFNYDLAFEGKYYDVWRRNTDSMQSIKSEVFGNNYQPGSKPTNCVPILNLANSTSGVIYYVERTPSVIVDLAALSVPPNWQKDSKSFGAITPEKRGSIQSVVEVPQSGKYEIFLGGSYPGRIELFIDFKLVFTGSTFFEGNPFLDNSLTQVSLRKGKHLIQIEYESPLWKPGSAVTQPMGPLYLTTESSSRAEVKSIGPEDLSQLCSKNLDWVAAIPK